MENLNSGAFAPTCTRETWVKRQALMARVRDFFVRRNALEVETPVLSAYGGTDPQLDYFEIEDPKRFMMTSPEFHMKRLLAAKFGDIFQITKSFRKDEFGGHHNNEFSMVEWYRVGMPQDKLAGVNPFCEKLTDFADACRAREIPVPEKSETLTREDWWDYLMVFLVEPALASNGPEFILDYPPSQAALAQTYVDNEGYTWARRFELFVNQVELCNGYTELTDPVEQRRRFYADLEIRKGMNKPLPPIDERFLAALESGMPACSGVALGLDRLFMLALGKEEIADVILFPSPIA